MRAVVISNSFVKINYCDIIVLVFLSFDLLANYPLAGIIDIFPHIGEVKLVKNQIRAEKISQ